jgi:hypothetical protein
MGRSKKLNIDIITHAANNEVPVFGSFESAILFWVRK